MTADTNNRNHRDSIFVEDAQILSQQAFAGDQYVLSVHAPLISKHAKPGQFAHVRCGIALPMRRPLSIMQVDEGLGTVDFLYKVFGQGTQILSRRHKGETLSIMGPIGQPFTTDRKYLRPLLIGGGVGIPPMVFIADVLRRSNTDYRPFVIMGSEVPFPFNPIVSKFVIDSMPESVNAGMPLMEDWGIASRLATLQGYSGCFNGYVTDLARIWLDALSEQQRSEVMVYSCGPHAMLQAVANLAAEYGLPCQVSLEEYMACAVGGCAGCVVKVNTPEGPAMKRVCVDGPVFDARTIF